MSHDLGPNLDVQRLMHEIRANVANQHRPVDAQNGTAAGSSNGHLEHKNHYHVNDLLRFHGEDFVRQAYRALLRREPDDPGMAHHLEQLASGRFNKMDVLASLHSSPEGRSSQVTISGLTLPVIVRRLGRIPLVGYLVRVAVGIGRLPRLVQYQSQFEFYTWSQQRNILERQDQHHRELSESLQQISAQILEMMQRAAEQQRANELTLQQYEQLIAKYHVFESTIAERLAEIRKAGEEQAQQFVNQQQHLARIDQTITQQNEDVSDFNRELRTELEAMSLRQEKTDTSLLMQERRLTVLLDEIKHSAAPHPLTEVAAKEQDHLLDALYASFEDQFRGSCEEISRRLQVYLPFLKEAKITGDVLDIGCGRGEWLQLLRSEGIEARGVDRNRVFIETCRGAGLEVVEQDALTYVRSQPDESLSAITAIHFVEHVPFEMLIAILDEIRRILKPGGLLIAETPNPENFMVGSCNFYADPTHRNPIPSETLKFLMESRGLRCKDVLKLRPWDEARLDGNSELISRFNEYFYSAPDYGIVATKP